MKSQRRFAPTRGEFTAESVARFTGIRTLAHQYIEQLDQRIRAAIFGNVGTIISFRVGAEDAKYLAEEFYPVFDKSDLANLSNYHIYLKLMIDGKTSQPFSAVTLPPPREKLPYKEKIIRFSRERYARQKNQVEKEILYRAPSSSKSYDQKTLF